MNLGGYEVAIGSDGQINPLTIEFLLENLGRAVMGGVRVNYLCIYDPEKRFAFDGTNAQIPKRGFTSLANPQNDGGFGQRHILRKKFKFSGSDTSSGGFGTIQDPLVGGGFGTL